MACIMFSMQQVWNVAVDVVNQPLLKCMKHYRPPHTKNMHGMIQQLLSFSTL